MLLRDASGWGISELSVLSDIAMVTLGDFQNFILAYRRSLARAPGPGEILHKRWTKILQICRDLPEIMRFLSEKCLS